MGGSTFLVETGGSTFLVETGGVGEVNKMNALPKQTNAYTRPIRPTIPPRAGPSISPHAKIKAALSMNKSSISMTPPYHEQRKERYLPQTYFLIDRREMLCTLPNLH